MTEKLKIDIEITPMPELAAKMFVGMDSERQAETLALIWRMMGEDYGGSAKRAMQCAYIRDELDPDAFDLIEELTEPEEEDHAQNPTHRKCCGTMWEDEHRDDCVSAEMQPLTRIAAALMRPEPFVADRVFPHIPVDDGEARAYWDGPEASPIEDIRTAIEKMEREVGHAPNKIVVPHGTIAALKERAGLGNLETVSPIMFEGVEIEELDECALAYAEEETLGVPAGMPWKHLRLPIDPMDSFMKSYREHRSPEEANNVRGVLDRLAAMHGGFTELYHDVETQMAGVQRTPIVTGTRSICSFLVADPANYSPGERVEIDGMAIGTVQHVNSDGTVQVALDYHQPDISKGTVVYEPVMDPRTRHLDRAIMDDAVSPYPLTSVDGDPNHPLVSTCDECKGTGWYVGFNTKEPCSKGCKSK